VWRASMRAIGFGSGPAAVGSCRDLPLAICASLANPVARPAFVFTRVWRWRARGRVLRRAEAVRQVDRTAAGGAWGREGAMDGYGEVKSVALGSGS
jgi:hypothetical protein